MHPIKHLFDDIYRNYWGITPAAERPKVRRLTKPAARNRDLWVRTERPGIDRRALGVRNAGVSGRRALSPASRR